ncbi:hypothetical protein AO377_1625 [Moraxella catarrhalis]|nr:hypothetical protein AO377_1625 [Moraxella catarrhalis]OAV12861.1 hypothetical protein AO375_1835 [Moraxella catarrhalis]OAV38172.1 hypothetical protein AO365_0016 [Moraxella catarrhalis]
MLSLQKAASLGAAFYIGITKIAISGHAYLWLYFDKMK